MKEFAYIHEEGKVPSTLRQVPFLHSFSEDHLDDILHASAIVECEPGDVIIEEGKRDSRIYILLAGEVEVSKDDEAISTIGKAGDIFGELAVVNDDARSASVVALSRTFCLAVDQKFLQLIKPKDSNASFYAALYEFVARVTAKRLHHTTLELAKVERELEQLKETQQLV